MSKEGRKYVAHWTYSIQLQNHVLVKVYELKAETKSMVQVRHWYGKRWHPKNNAWKVES